MESKERGLKKRGRTTGIRNGRAKQQGQTREKEEWERSNQVWDWQCLGMMMES